MNQIEKAVEAAAEVVVADAVAWVKAHPNYPRIVEALGTKALEAIAAGL